VTGPPLRKVAIDGALDLLSRRPDLEPTVIIGEEVEACFPETGQWAHVNVLGVDENHPLQSYRMQKKPMRFVEDVLELFTHVELGNGT
jgi:hypothetical protein